MPSTAYKTETTQENAKFVNSQFVKKAEERTKEAAQEASAFIRGRLRQSSFARKIIEPVMVTADDLDPSDQTDNPRIIIEKEPESSATWVPFYGTPQRKMIRGPKVSGYFGKIVTSRFRRSKFQLLTYKNDVRKIISDNFVADLADQEDQKFYDTISSIVGTSAPQHIVGSSALSRTDAVAALKYITTNEFPAGKFLCTAATKYDLLLQGADDIGDRSASDQYDKGIEARETLWGIPCVTTIKSTILPDDELWLFASEEHLGKFYLLQDATLHIKQEADMFEMYAYSVPSITIVNTTAMVRIKLS